MAPNSNWRRLIRTTSCFTIRIEISSPLHSRDNLSTVRLHKRKTDILYKLPSPRFEPTTFLIQVNTKPVFTPKTTVPWPQFSTFWLIRCRLNFPFNVGNSGAQMIQTKHKENSVVCFSSVYWLFKICIVKWTSFSSISYCSNSDFIKTFKTSE